MQHELALDAAGGGDDRLRGHLPAEDPLALGARLRTAVEVDLEALEVEQGRQLVGAARHQRPSQPPASSPLSLDWSFESSSRSARNASNALPISSPVGSGSSPASREDPLASASRKESYCCSSPRTTSPTSSWVER